MLKMLVLKMLMFSFKKCIAIIYYKCKLTLFGRDDKKQAKSLIFIGVSQAGQVPKVQKERCY